MTWQEEDPADVIQEQVVPPTDKVQEPPPCQGNWNVAFTTTLGPFLGMKLRLGVGAVGVDVVDIDLIQAKSYTGLLGETPGFASTVGWSDALKQTVALTVAAPTGQFGWLEQLIHAGQPVQFWGMPTNRASFLMGQTTMDTDGQATLLWQPAVVTETFSVETNGWNKTIPIPTASTPGHWYKVRVADAEGAASVHLNEIQPDSTRRLLSRCATNANGLAKREMTICRRCSSIPGPYASVSAYATASSNVIACPSAQAAAKTGSAR